MPNRTNFVGAALGAFAVLVQSLNAPASAEGFSLVIGKVIVGALVGAWIARVVMRRFS